MALFSRRRKKDEPQYSQNPYSQQANFSSVTGEQKYIKPPQQQNYSQNYSQPKNYSSQQPNYSSADGRQMYVAPPKQTQQPQRRPIQNQPQQTPQQPTQNQLLQNYMGNRGQRVVDRVGQIQNQAQDAADLQAELAEKRASTLSNLQGMATDAYGQYANQVRSGADIQRKSGERQIGETQDIYEDQRYSNEKSRQERMRGLESTLASLGTLQSSAFNNVGAMVNQGAERMDRQDQRARNARIAEIQDAVAMAENQAEQLIQQEGARYLQQMEMLRGQFDENSIEYKQALQQIAEQANNNINNILDGYDQFSYEAQMQMLQDQQEQENQLSDIFLTTGQPQNRADYEWLMENPDFQNKQSGQMEEQMQAQNALNIANELIEENLGAETGVIQSRLPAITQRTQDTISKIEQLKATLELAAAGQLKGQGQVSEGEREILRRAASGLDRARSEDEFRRALMQAKQILEAKVGVQGRQDPVQASNAQLLQQYGG